MGMYASLIRISEDDLNKFKLNSELLDSLIMDEANHNAEWLLDLDKTWDGIQYLLTGKGISNFQSPPTIIGRAIFSDQLLDPEQDMGYGPAQYLTPDQVRETATALGTLELSALKESLDVVEMEKLMVYPGFWSQAGTLDFLLDSFAALQAFYTKAASNHQAIVSFLC